MPKKHSSKPVAESKKVAAKKPKATQPAISKNPIVGQAWERGESIKCAPNQTSK